MLRKIAISTLSLALMSPLSGIATTNAAAATPAIKFGYFKANPAGNDNPITNYKLNSEYIVIKNTTNRTISLGGYTVRDNGAKHVYRVPTGFKLGAYKSVTLRTGKGTNTTTNLYWGQAVGGASPVTRNGYVWNNDTDTAVLRNASGVIVHACKYTSNSTGGRTC